MRWPAQQVEFNLPQAGGHVGSGGRVEWPSLIVAENGGREGCETHARVHTRSQSGPGTVT